MHVGEVWFLITLNASTISMNTTLFYILVCTEYICIFIVNTKRVNQLEILFLIYTLLLVRWSAKEITQHQALLSIIFNAY
jgi:hypothetical protein